QRYFRKHPQVGDHVTRGAAVFVPSKEGLTVPQPDVAAYRDFPHERLNSRGFSWREVFPLLVARIAGPDAINKDFFRDVQLYELVASIREYWIVIALDGINQTS